MILHSTSPPVRAQPRSQTHGINPLPNTTSSSAYTLGVQAPPTVCFLLLQLLGSWTLCWPPGRIWKECLLLGSLPSVSSDMHPFKRPSKTQLLTSSSDPKPTPPPAVYSRSVEQA